MKAITLSVALSASVLYTFGQDKPARSLSLEEYEKAKAFVVKDLDNDSYVKFENTYVLDRYESRKPYFITGDDGKKKRIDIYKLLAKEGMADLGVMVFYTNETGKVFKAVMPSFTADAKVWNKYFEDIHAIDKQEANFVLKLSYVLSKEFGFQLYKAANAGKDLSKESGTYGNDICFPGSMLVSMADGGTRALETIQPGDRIVTVDAATQQAKVVTVKELTTHAASNYALTQLTLLGAQETLTAEGTTVVLSARTVAATPNHPVKTRNGDKKMGDVRAGDEILCQDMRGGGYQAFRVWQVTEGAGGHQQVYNIVADGGSTFVMNGVMVLQK